jgi:hypothetical protein
MKDNLDKVSSLVAANLTEACNSFRTKCRRNVKSQPEEIT